MIHAYVFDFTYGITLICFRCADSKYCGDFAQGRAKGARAHHHQGRKYFEAVEGVHPGKEIDRMMLFIVTVTVPVSN